MSTEITAKNQLDLASSDVSVQILQSYFGESGLGDFDAALALRNNKNLRCSSSVELIRYIWDSAVKRAGDALLGLNAGESFSKVCIGHLLINIAANSASAGSALVNVCKYHEVCSDVYGLQINHENKFYTIHVAPYKTPADDLDRHIIECIFSAIVSILKRLCQANILPFVVNLPWSNAGPYRHYHNVFGENINFNSSAASLTYTQLSMRTPIPYSNAHLLDRLKEHADEFRTSKAQCLWANKVRAILHRHQSAPIPDIEEVAHKLCISTRKLQLHLKAENIGFREIRNDTLTALAKAHLLDGNFSITEIADLLGYSEQSSFNHAFKNWTGLSPKAFLKEKRSVSS